MMCFVSGKTFLAFILVLLLLSSVHAQIEQEFLPHTHTLREMALRLDVIEERYQDVEFDIAVEQLKSIRVQSEFLFPGLQPSQQQEAKQLIARSLLIETVLNFYQGNLDNAQNIADELLRRDSAATLSGTLATPELAEWFEDIRDKHTGFLSVLTTPPGAEVYLEGVKIGRTPLENAFAPAGTRTLKISMNGYAAFEQHIHVPHGDTTIINVDLTRNTGSLILWISPPGAVIELDHLPTHLQTRPAPGELYPLILQMGLNPIFVSSPLIITNIPVGERLLSIKKDCRKTLEYKIVFDAADYYLPFIVMQKTETGLTLLSPDRRGRVYIDGKVMGETPLHGVKTCPGQRHLLVDYGNGMSWSETVWLEPDALAVFSAIPRPNLLFLGCHSSYRNMNSNVETAMFEQLCKTGAFNCFDIAESRRYRIRPSVAAVLEPLMTPDFNPDDVTWRKKLQDMTTSLAETRAQLIAFARPVPSGSTGNTLLFFVHRDSNSPDILRLNPGFPGTGDTGMLQDMITDLPRLTRLRSGLRVTQMGRTLFISEIIPGGNAELSPLKTGDTIVSLNNIPVSTRTEFETVLRDPDSPELMPISVDRSGQRIQTGIQMNRQPLIESLADSRRLWNIHYAYLQVQAFGFEQVPSWLTLAKGVCCLAMQRPDLAIRHFDSTVLPDSDGINSGTLSWLKYLAANAIRNRLEADANYRKAADSHGATIFHGDGPSLQSLLQ